MRGSFKVEELNANILWSLLGHPIDYEHGDDIYVLSGGLMLGDVIHILWHSKCKSATLRTIVLALFDYRLMKHYKFSITFKSELLLGQSKTPMTSRCSRSLVFAVCGVHGSIVHEHGWSCNRWMSRCGTVWVGLLKGTFWYPQGSLYRVYPAGIPRAVLPGISKIRPMASDFIPATEVPTTLPFKRHGRSEFAGLGEDKHP